MVPIMRAFSDPAYRRIVAVMGTEPIRDALPLGLGKANHVANALFARAAADPSINLRIFTALTLETPRSKGDLERRFLEPVVDRVFAGYPDLAYALALHAGTGDVQVVNARNDGAIPGLPPDAVDPASPGHLLPLTDNDPSGDDPVPGRPDPACDGFFYALLHKP